MDLRQGFLQFEETGGGVRPEQAIPCTDEGVGNAGLIMPMIGLKSTMVSLLEIESATKELSPKEREELLVFLAETLRNERAAQMPEPRSFSNEEIGVWIAEDEADMKSLRDAK